MILTESFHQMPNATRNQGENVQRTFFSRMMLWCVRFYTTKAYEDIANFIFRLLLRWFVIGTTRSCLIRIVIFFLRHHRQLLVGLFIRSALWCSIHVIDSKPIIFKWTSIGLCHFSTTQMIFCGIIVQRIN